MLGDTCTCANYTCQNIHGQSVADYALVSDEILRHILSFIVYAFLFIIRHSL